MVENKKYECRYDGCDRSFKNRSGLNYHEKKVHGMLHTQHIRNQPPIEKDEHNFVQIKEVKLMADKKPKEIKDTDTCGGCNEQIPTGSKFCPKCGVEFE